MFRGIVFLSSCHAVAAVVNAGGGCVMDPAGKDVCPEYHEEDRTALLQNQVSVVSLKSEPVTGTELTDEATKDEGDEEPIAGAQVNERDDADAGSEGHEDGEDEIESEDANEKGAEDDGENQEEDEDDVEEEEEEHEMDSTDDQDENSDDVDKKLEDSMVEDVVADLFGSNQGAALAHMETANTSIIDIDQMVLEQPEEAAKDVKELQGTADSMKSGVDKALVQIETEIGSLIDIDAMVVDQQTQAAKEVKELTETVDKMKPEVDKAKLTFTNARKAIRDNYRKCRKKNKNKWKSAKECKPFVSFLFTSAEKKQTENKKCAKKAKCELRQAKRKAQRAAKEAYQDERRDFRDYKKQLRKAKFQENVLPKVIKLLKPSLLSALTQVDTGKGEEGILASCADPLSVEKKDDCVPLNEITGVDLLENYMTVQLHKGLYPVLDKLFKKVTDKIWKLVKPIKDSVKSTITTAVGTIPVVGGMLATAVGLLIEALYFAVKWGVDKAFDKIQELLQGELVTKIVKAVLDTGVFTEEALQKPLTDDLKSKLKDTADSVQEEVLSATQKKITLEAANAEDQAKREADDAESSIETEAQIVEREEEADDESDLNDEEEQDRLDIDDEDD